MTSEQSDSRPPAKETGHHNTSTGTRLIESGDKLQELAEYIDGAFVVLLRYPSGRRHRRCFLTLRAADHAAKMALARGQAVEVVLAELRPLFRVAP
jgi:hypothetical protein